MNREDGRCPSCGASLNPSSPICPSCGSNILQTHIDDLGGYKIQPRPHSIALTPRNLVLGGIIVLLIAIVPTIAFLNLVRSGNSQSTQAPMVVPTQQSPTPIPPTPTAPSTPTTEASTSIPTSTSCTPSCIIAYQENGSNGWQGWSLASDWRVVENNKLLSDDGSAGSNQAGPSAIPPYSLPKGTQNFAIEAGITIPQGMSNAHVSITACGSTATNGWQGYEGVISSNSQAQIYADQDQLAHTNFSPNQGLYTYRLEVKGNVISLFVNGGLVVQATDNKFLPCGSQIGGFGITPRNGALGFN